MAMGCSLQGESDDDENTGVAQVAISQVPFDGSVGCIAVTAVGQHTKTKSVDVAPGQSTVLTLNGLPVGTVSFSADAFPGPCAAVTPASAPSWISDSVLATVSNVQPVMVHLTMRRSGSAGVDVDFQDGTCSANGVPCFSSGECCSLSCVDNTCQPSQPVCPPGSMMCNGVCANIMNDPFNCGGCGNFCPGGMCMNGACVNQPPVCWDGIQNGTETGVDCGGGQCAPCWDGQGCLVSADCQSNVCIGNVCHSPTCVDGVKNGPESDVDCGGWCAPCADGKQCFGSFDCQSGNCLNGVCQPQQQQCQTAFDCPGSDFDCQFRSCTAGVCGFANAPAGTVVSFQSVGDCMMLVCDGNGLIVNIGDDADTPDDNNQCTVDGCSFGAPFHMVVPNGTSCSQNGGMICDNGSCI
jgi:hypothetical protein